MRVGSRVARHAVDLVETNVTMHWRKIETVIVRVLHSRSLALASHTHIQGP